MAGPHLKAGKVRPIATWGAVRLAAYPDVPTLKELGYDVEYYLWTGLFAPRGIPASVLATLRDAARQGVQDPDFRAAMAKIETPIAYLDTDGPGHDRRRQRQALPRALSPVRGLPSPYAGARIGPPC